MTQFDDLDPVARGVRVQRLDGRFRWPDGRHVAIVFNSRRASLDLAEPIAGLSIEGNSLNLRAIRSPPLEPVPSWPSLVSRARRLPR